MRFMEECKERSEKTDSSIGYPYRWLSIGSFPDDRRILDENMKGINVMVVLSIATIVLLVAIGGSITHVDATEWSKLQFSSDPVSGGTQEEGIGKIEFHILDSDRNDTVYEAWGVNAAEALKNYGLLDVIDSSMDGECLKDYYSQSIGSFQSVNDEYGALTRNASSATDGNVWNVFVYTYDGNNNAGQWKAADKTLGFYRPFDDYNRSYATANIALYYGPDTATAPAILSIDDLQPLTAVTETSAFELNFEIMYGDEYLFLTGYGSDAALALIDAVGNVVSLNMVPGVSYGYLNSMYGLATSDDSGSWMYWHMMADSKSDSEYMDSAFYDENGINTLGLYTPLDGFAYGCNIISLTYY